MGSIVTFYSYKGGVGRTMTLANIAILLAQKQKKVLMVDWDLEAPGLPEYFRDYGNDIDKKPGLLDLLSESKESEQPEDIDWEEYISPLKVDDTDLYLMSSGVKTDSYSKKVLDFDWNLYFRDSNGGNFIEYLRDSWRQKFDFILVDSRTGITDSGGICTIQLPDILAAVFTANYQSLLSCCASKLHQ